MGRGWKGAVAGAAALCMVACGGAGRWQHPPTPADVGAGLDPIGPRDVTRVLERVTGARRLQARRPVRVHTLEREAFLARLHEGDGTSAGSDEEARAFLLGFDFVPEPSRRADVPAMKEVLDEEVAGFYDERRDEIFVPRVRPSSESQALVQRAVLAHEVQHALQAQHFEMPGDADSSDESLARLALVEGDAQVAMGAYVGSELGEPVGRTLRRIREAIQRVPIGKLHGGERKALDRTLDLVRERLVFPYEHGTFFVTDLYRAGGFDLVDAAFSRPPTTTEHVLHPQKYLAGEQPRAFGTLPPPAGMRVVARDVLGELQIRVMLSRCLDRDKANAAAAGWNGDALSVLASAGGRLVVGWSSAWDTEQDAREMEQALAGAEGCFGDNALGSMKIDRRIVTRRKGDVVAFVRGADDALARTLLGALVDLPGRAAATTPISDRIIPPRLPLPEPTPGRVEGDVYRNEWLGVVARIPSGMRARTATDDMDLIIDRQGEGVTGAMTVSPRVHSPEQNERTFREVQSAFARAVDQAGLSVAPVRRGPTTTPLGAGVERVWNVVGTPVELRVVLVPICATTGSIVVVTTHADRRGRAVLDGWISTMRWASDRNVVACDFLDPK